ncbi:unnamed protein product [Peronospora destructor]|uniref:HTH CENPB-type domain-containing protein n=1 Tax=Peronospora destructor TaxID=86335 RepID=A0AAV0TW76_9STRA|nr:unnamed protein product [Peronospora destructor]
MSSRSRHHLTIGDKNRLRRYHKQHPELTQEQLREWAYTTFGQWVARSTVGHIVRGPEEVSANPEATRFQSGRYPDMEQELYAVIEARWCQVGVDVKQVDRSHGLVLNDAELWTKANEILKRTRGSDESVSVAWVHRFKKRHGLHRLQLKRAAAAVVATEREDVEMQQQQQTVVEHYCLDETECAVLAVTGNKRSATEVTESSEVAGTRMDSVRKRPATTVARISGACASAAATADAAASTSAVGTRSHFVSSDDILLLTHVLAIKPWGFPYAMDGWQQVVEKLRSDDSFRLEKTAGACQARINLLLSHMKAGNTLALRKSGTETEFDTKCALIAEVAMQIDEYARATQKGNGKSLTEVGAPISVAKVRREAAACTWIPDLDRERMAQRRLELMERKMDRELAAQKRHSEEQVMRLEKLHREQQQTQQEQHAQLLATIQQQQAMMCDLIKLMAPTSRTGANAQEV